MDRIASQSTASRFDARDPGRPSPRTARLDVATITDPAALSGLEAEWRDLCQRTPECGFFQTFAWVWPWWKHLGEPAGYRLRIVTVRADGRLVLIWPLVVRRQGLWRIGVWLGDGCGQYADVVIEEGADRAVWLEAAWQVVNAACGMDALHLQDIRRDAVVRRFLSERGAGIRATAAAPYVDIGEYRDWDAFHAALKRGFRRNLARTRRRLDEKGRLVHRAIEDPAEIERVVSKSISLKLGWLKRRNLYGRLLERPGAEGWLIDAALAAQRDGTLRMAALCLDDAIIATSIGFLFRRRYCSYLASFDVGYDMFQPGKIETADALMWAFGNDAAVFDLMPPADDYKRDWASHEVTVETFDGYPTAWGRISRVWYGTGLRDKAIRLYRRLPRRWRRLIVRPLIR